MPQPRRFFFYGTLTGGGGNPFAEIVSRHMRRLGPARVTGRLYAIPTARGWYPVLTAGTGSLVSGYLYAACPSLTRQHIAMLDRYEECRPRCRAASLYWRTTIAVQTDHGRKRTAQAYRFCRPLPRSALAIADDSFAAWLDATGHRPYRPRPSEGR